MVMLKKIIKAVIWTVLLNGVVRGAFKTVLTKSMRSQAAASGTITYRPC
jgi:hypothetical protein